MSNRDRERKWNSSFLRKIRKPIVERKRRNRINKCLAELKEILLENMKRNGDTQIAKLDKADILEMTVKHLRTIQQQRLSVAMTTGTSCMQQFRHGFTECAQEAIRFMSTSGSYSGSLTSNINEHLTRLVSNQCDSQSNRLVSFTAEDLQTTSCETPERKCRSASPTVVVGRRLQFSPISRDNVSRQIAARVSRHAQNRDNNVSRNPMMRIPFRFPVDDDDSPQRNLWRPF